MYLGIDLGTSGVKAVLINDRNDVEAQATAELHVSRPKPMWSEQDPHDWWEAADKAILALKRDHGTLLMAVRGIGLSGQMHGATLLDKADRPLRPAILWNDGRSGEECAELERAEPRSRQITGNPAMAGFTAPKLLWVRKHEPKIFKQTAKVLLPKDYLRLLMTGERVSDMSDAAGTLWLDVGKRQWSDAMLAATDLGPEHMPALAEGTGAVGTLRADVAKRWGIPATAVVAGGAGDNAASAAGIGVLEPGSAFLSLGTSGVLFVADDGFYPDPERTVHAFCHCLPDRWHRMSVILSAAASLSWFSHAAGAANEAQLMAEAGQLDRVSELLFLPYLSGERTPHNDPHAQGVFFGLTPVLQRGDLTRAVLEGVAFAFADGLDVLSAAGQEIGSIAVIGGGSRSPFWGKILAAALNRPLDYLRGGDVGAAHGAARLGRLAATGEAPEAVLTRPETDFTVNPGRKLTDFYARKRERYRTLYQTTKDLFPRKT